MSHIVRKPDWAVVDLDTVGGRVFCQQRWQYEWLVVPPARGWTYAERRAFHHALDSQVWGIWSNRILLRTEGTNDFCRTHPTVEVEFDIRWVLSNPHWSVDVRKMPPGSNPTTFISNVEPSKGQIHLDTADLASYRPQNAAGERRTFRALPHEFGHTMENPDEYVARSPHLVDTDSIMNIGRQIRERHVRLLLAELDRMIDHCRFTFGGPAVRRISRGPKVDARSSSSSAASLSPAASKSPPPPDDTADDSRTWFEVKVLDEVGEPVAGLDVTFAVGANAKATTGGNGVARVADVKTSSSFGSMTVTSAARAKEILAPRWTTARDQKLTEGAIVRPVGTSIDSVPVEAEKTIVVHLVPPTQDWIEIEVFDGDDKPIVNQPFLLVLSDGSERRGSTDDVGLIRVTQIPSGPCKVNFPEIEKYAKQ